MALPGTVHVNGRWFDDLREGEVFWTQGVTLTEEAVIRFALEWDVQPFHVDAEAASTSMFGGLIGSGLQTVMLTYRLYHMLGLVEGTAKAGLGIDGIRFLKPTRPGDTLRVQVTVAALRASRQAGRGIATMAMETYNQRKELVLTMTLSALVARRPSQPETA
ncbi:MaoC/PaaZ C-terminal domain-containing protein [Zavarzinia compransoris]|uniref:Acyl dehydratase n=1 Tax=Zavarzinia compransoris TaxID=1264899 RepID=A0A317E8N3_9PROT|nr:MaoC/PaaZ C-terminal domain-containing protein [Zavarzinia compransoris]PWR21643.1 acyl dehydratase [Zavarzinia compransoris]TDP45576.1 acyl dehydratase [Zavarzinia compransoris]